MIIQLSLYWYEGAVTMAEKDKRLNRLWWIYDHLDDNEKDKIISLAEELLDSQKKMKDNKEVLTEPEVF